MSRERGRAPRGRSKRNAAGGEIGRRGFLKGSALAGAVALSAARTDGAKAEEPAAAAPLRPSRLDEGLGPHADQNSMLSSAGSDYMLDVLRKTGIDRVAFVPGDTFRGLHESLINYGMLTEPRMSYSAVNHEETSVAFCHGYAKVAGKPMACFVHAAVGLQHASMALYNAWADRVPVFCIAGARIYSAERRMYVDWVHSVFDGPSLVRDFTKWDETPLTLGDFGEAAVRAYKFAMTPPYGPVVLQVDMTLQENPMPDDKPPPIPSLPRSAPPAGGEAAVNDVARMLVAAENPVIAADRAARTPKGLALMVELAEALQCAVVDSHARMNFPWRHPLNQSSRQQAAVADADLVLGLEMTDFHGVIGRLPRSVKRLSITSQDLYMKSNYGDYQQLADVELAVEADAEATLPALIEAVRRLTSRNRRSTFEARGKRLAEAHQAALEASREAAALGWDEQPISVARLCQELYALIRNDDWALVNGTVFQNYWPQQLWHADKHYQYIGDAGAYGLGYLPGAALGAATAHAEHGRLAVAIGGDGDFLFSPSVMWAAAHNRIPILYIIHNNKAYFNEIMAVQRIANRRNRGIDRTGIGNDLDRPAVDYAMLAKSMGVAAFGPVTDPNALRPVLKSAIEMVKKGEPVLVDVVAQGR